MSVNLWFEDVVDAFLRACAEGVDWRKAVAEAEREARGKPRRVLTQEGLAAKGIAYSRQHIRKRVRDGAFPSPFQMPDCPVGKFNRPHPKEAAELKSPSP